MYGIVPSAAFAENLDAVKAADELVLPDEQSLESPDELTEDPPDEPSGEPSDDNAVGEPDPPDDLDVILTDDTSTFIREIYSDEGVGTLYSDGEPGFNTLSTGNTTLWFENFDGTPKMRSIVYNPVAGIFNPGWEYINRGTASAPTLPSAPSGNWVARFNSFETSLGNRAYLENITEITSLGTGDIHINFHMYHNNGNPAGNDTLRVGFAIGESDIFLLGDEPIQRFSSTNGWEEYTLIMTGEDVKSRAGEDVRNGFRFYVCFIGTSAFGHNMYIDSITVTQEPDGGGGGDDCSGPTFIDTESPYTGSHIVIYNSSTDITTGQTTGTLPAADMGGFSVNASSGLSNIPSRAKEIYEIDGEFIYELEPHDYLERRTFSSGTSMSQSGGVQASSYASVIGAPVNTTAWLPTYNFAAGQDIDLQARLLYSGKYCDVWVELAEVNNGYITTQRAALMGQEFDNKIRTFMLDNFGEYVSNDGEIFTGGRRKNGKIIIFLQDIRDGFTRAHTSGGYIGGYFFSGDYNISGLSMVHVDIFPLMWASGSTTNPDNYEITLGYSTLVHEFQHLINFSVPRIYGRSYSELWWNEAFSMAAEHMMGYTRGTTTVAQSRIADFNNVTDNRVRNGAILNFTSYPQNDNSIAANYGMPFLFGQYLRTQTKDLPGGGNSIYKSIIAHPQGDHRAIMGGLAAVGYPVTEFDILHRNFRIAMVQKDATGYFGFAGESIFDAINTPLHSALGTVNLNGGAAIVRRITPEGSSLTHPAGAGSNIQFAGFGARSSQTIAFPGSNAPLTKIFGDAPFTHVTSLAGPGGTGAITYSSDITNVATVNNSTGLVTINGTGTAVITAVKAECESYMRTTASYTLTVNMPQPNITTHPINSTASVGGTETFSVAIAAPPTGITVSYQWQRSINNGSSWSDIPGATNPGYMTPTLDSSDDGNQYRCRVTFSMGRTTTTHLISNHAVLSVQYFITPSPLSGKLPDAYRGYNPADPSVVITFTNTGNNPLDGLEVSLGGSSPFVITNISVSSDLTLPAAEAAISETIAPDEYFTVTIKPKGALDGGKDHTDELTLSGTALPAPVSVPLSFSVLEPVPPSVLVTQTLPRNRQVVCPVKQTTLTIPFDRPMKPNEGTVTIVSAKGHDMTFDLSSPTKEWNWNTNADSLEITLRPVVHGGPTLNFLDTYIVVVSKEFESSDNEDMKTPYVFSFMTDRANTNGNIRRIQVRGMHAVINNAIREHTIEIPHYNFDLSSITASDFNILLDSSDSVFDRNDPAQIKHNTTKDRWEISVKTDHGMPFIEHTVVFVKWGVDTRHRKSFDEAFGIDYLEGTVELGRANSSANDNANQQGYWYFIANNQHIVPAANNFTQLARNHKTGVLDLNSHLNASTPTATRTLHVLDWIGSNSRPTPAQFDKARDEGKLMSIPLLRQATAAELSDLGAWHYEYDEMETISAAQDKLGEFGNSARTVSLTGDVYEGASWEIRSSNSIANDNNLLAEGTGKGLVNDYLVDEFESFTIAQRTRLSGNAARDIFVRLTGDQAKGLFASHVATLRIAADTAMTSNAGMSSANNVASFVNYAAHDPIDGTIAVWRVPDSRYDYEYILREVGSSWSPSHPDVIDDGDWKPIMPDDPLPEELFTYNTVANPQFHVRRMECTEKNHPRSAPSVAFRFAPLRAPVNLAANNINRTTMNITGRTTAQEYIVLRGRYEELQPGCEEERINPNTDPERDNRIGNAGDIIQGWTRAPGINIPIRPEWIAAGAYIYIRTAATATAPAGMVGNLERRNSNVANPFSLINPPIKLSIAAPNDFLFGMSNAERDRVVSRLFVFNITNGRFSLNTLANFPNEARTAGYTNRSAIQVSSNNEFWVAPGSSDLRPHMNIDGDIATHWVRIAGSGTVRPSAHMQLHINIRTGEITSATG
jgi:hypothetical protein